MHAEGFIQDLAIIMLVAGFVTLLFHRLKQPVVLGYVLAGFIIGPYATAYPFITNEETIKTLGELGVVFLMFSLGLEFSLRKLARVGITAFVAALAQIILLIWLGYEIGQYFSWNKMDSMFLGAMMAISSTTITIKALEELGLKKEKSLKKTLDSIIQLAGSEYEVMTWEEMMPDISGIFSWKLHFCQYSLKLCPC